jgi:hypothetical protein
LEGVGNEKAEHLKVAVDQRGNEVEAKQLWNEKQDESRTDDLVSISLLSAVDSSSVLIR